jgi:hypothetical protein
VPRLTVDHAIILSTLLVGSLAILSVIALAILGGSPAGAQTVSLAIGAVVTILTVAVGVVTVYLRYRRGG